MSMFKANQYKFILKFGLWLLMPEIFKYFWTFNNYVACYKQINHLLSKIDSFPRCQSFTKPQRTELEMIIVKINMYNSHNHDIG